MKILILGGGRPLGQVLASELQRRGMLRDQPIAGLCLADQVAPPCPAGDIACHGMVLDTVDRARIDAVLALGWDAIFALDEAESGAAEADFALGMRGNFFGGFNLFDAIRASGTAPMLVFASSIAALGPSGTGDAPTCSYGAQKRIAETLLTDYARREAFDGRIARLPHLMVLPEAPERAAGAFLSHIVRETMAGRPALCPVAGTTRLRVASLASTAANLIALAECAPDALHGPVNLPSLATDVDALIDATAKASAESVHELVDFEPDPAIEALLMAFPVDVPEDLPKATSFVADKRLAAILVA